MGEEQNQQQQGIPSPNIPTPQQSVPVVNPGGLQPQQPSPQHPSNDLEQRFTTLMDALEEERRRRSGLDRQNREYDRRFAALEGTLGEIQQAIQGLTGQAPNTNTQEQQGPGEQEQQGNAAPPPDLLTEMQVEFQQLKAEKLRDDLITELTRPGQPGEGLDLWLFRDNIKLTGDPESQREAIMDMIKGLKGVVGQAAQQTGEALAQGMTPGSSPKVPSQNSELDEAKSLHAKLNDSNYLEKMQREDPDKLNKELERYDELLAKYGSAVTAAYTMPWARLPEMSQMISSLAGQVSALSQKAGMPFPLGG